VHQPDPTQAKPTRPKPLAYPKQHPTHHPTHLLTDVVASDRRKFVSNHQNVFHPRQSLVESLPSNFFRTALSLSLLPLPLTVFVLSIFHNGKRRRQQRPSRRPLSLSRRVFQVVPPEKSSRTLLLWLLADSCYRSLNTSYSYHL
jgi:hypothetical protein